MPIASGLPSIIKSIQHRVINFSSGTSKTDTIAAVDPAKTVIIQTGHTIGASAVGVAMVLTNATTVTCTLSSAQAGNVYYDVVEYN